VFIQLLYLITKTIESIDHNNHVFVTA